MIWNILTAIATLVSMVAYIVTARYIHDELKGLEKDRYLNVTSELFSTWHSIDFMQAQLWLMHRMQETEWHAFVAAHRADNGEIAFHRVGAFYDRVGTLVRLGLINEQEILPVIGGWAIAVWQKIAPLVEEARRIENSTLFSDFERLLPSCYECYVPSLGMGEPVATVMSMDVNSTTGSHQALVTKHRNDTPPDRIRPDTLKARLAKGEPITVVDVRRAEQIAQEGKKLPHAILIPPDALHSHYSELPPDREVAVYCA